MDRKNTLKLKTIFVILASGVFMGLSPAPLNLWLLSWFTLAPLWLLLNQTKQLKQAAFFGLIWGFAYHSLALFWITGVHPMTWMGVPWLASLLIAIACWLIISFWGAFFVVCWSVIFNFINHNFFVIKQHQKITIVLIRVLLGVTIWCLLETLWSYSPLWWSSLSYTQSPDNLAILQLSKFSGFNTINVAIVAVNGLIAESIFGQKQEQNSQIIQKQLKLITYLPIILFIGLHLWGLYLYKQPITNNLKPIQVGIIQGNIPNEIKLYSQGWQKAIQGYTTGYQKLAQQKIDIVLTPETALPFYWDDITNNSEFYQTVLREKVPVWLGAYGRKEQSYTNSLFTLTGKGKTYSRYDKTKLVPLGEYIPFEPIIGKIINRLSPLEAHLAAGKSNQTFDTPFGKAIVGICYESAFSQHFRRQTKAGGEFIITASNNAHYSAAMPAQHHAQDVIRAIESDRWAARATNTGYSAIVDPHGNTIWRSQINQYQTYIDTIYTRKTKTLYVQRGDWLTVSLLIVTTVLILIDKNLTL